MESEWITVCSIADFPSEGRQAITVADTPVIVFYHDDEYLAYQDFCPHAGLPIGEGTVDSGRLYCPYHGAGFCLKTGKTMGPPAYSDLIAFETRLHNELIQVKAP